VKGIRIAADTGLYPYVVSVATRDFLEAGRFWSFLGFARDIGAREVHLLEPCAVGRLAGREDVLLGAAERQLILKYQEEAADKVDLPVLSSYAYLESPETFGCGAGLTHLYIDGSGEVCPCQLVPISFGNILADPLGTILERMGEHFIVPRTACCGKVLARHIPLGKLPTNLLESEKICEKYLPKHHKVPGFFKALKESQDEVGIPELAEAYNQIHESYDQFWLDKAALPIETLVEAIPIENCREIFEAGCGTGYATALLSRSLNKDAHLMAVDLSEGMLEEAKKRLGSQELCQVTLKLGDALEEMEKEGPFDLVFSSWVLGYIPLSPFFNAAYRSLRSQGLLAFLVHLENSPREPLEIFGKIVGRDPSVLTKRIAFDFPKSLDHLESKLQNAGFQILHSFRDAITFSYSTPEEVLRHLLKSGAGTAFYEALEPERRGDLENDFLEMLSFRNRNQPNFNVIHDYLSCLAKKI
jgi:protein-L-isoaspartate O-methyltransferase